MRPGPRVFSQSRTASTGCIEATIGSGTPLFRPLKRNYSTSASAAPATAQLPVRPPGSLRGCRAVLHADGAQCAHLRHKLRTTRAVPAVCGVCSLARIVLDGWHEYLDAKLQTDAFARG